MILWEGRASPIKYSFQEHFSSTFVPQTCFPSPEAIPRGNPCYQSHIFFQECLMLCYIYTCIYGNGAGYTFCSIHCFHVMFCQLIILVHIELFYCTLLWSLCHKNYRVKNNARGYNRGKGNKIHAIRQKRTLRCLSVQYQRQWLSKVPKRSEG